MNRNTRIRWLRFGAIFVALAIVAAGPLAGQSSRRTHTQPVSDPHPAIKPAGLPAHFRVGEKLDYRVGWANFTSAATVRLAVAERRNLFGWDTWHLRAVTHTLNPVRVLFAIDDQFDSYTDAATLSSHQYEMYLNEQGKHEGSVLRLLAQGEPSRGDAPSVVVLPGTRDPVGALYALREVDWQRTREAASPVYDGRNVYDLRAKLQAAREQVTVPAGTYSASKVFVRVFERGQQAPKVTAAIWFAWDPAKTPVLMEAELPFGSLRVELISSAE